MSFGFCSIWMAVVYTTLYAVVSRLPMIFAMVHMVYGLELEGSTPAFIFCGYCIARLLAAIGTVTFFGMPVMFLGTFTGVIGYLAIMAYPTNVPIFGAMIILTGFTETVTGIDGLLKIECLIDDLPPSFEQLLFRFHLLAATAGSFLAYLGGGFIFEAFGIRGTCLFGAGVSILNCFVLIVYCLKRRSLCQQFFLKVDDVLQQFEKGELEALDDLNENLASQAMRKTTSRVTSASGRSTVTSVESEAGMEQGSRKSAWDPVVPNTIQEQSEIDDADIRSVASDLSMFDQLEEQARIYELELKKKPARRASQKSEQVQEAPAKKNQASKIQRLRDLPRFVDMGPQEQRRVTMACLALVLSFYVTVLPISNNFGVLALYWQRVWNKGTTVSGMLMAVGELGGLCVLQVLGLKSVFRLKILRPFRKPVNLILATMASSTTVAAVTMPSIAISACGSVGVHVINVLLHSFCSECAAAWAPHDVYTKWIGRCYLSKRFSNATVAMLTINLFFMKPDWPQRPYVAVSSIVFVWSIFLFTVFWWLDLLPHQEARRLKAEARSSKVSPQVSEEQPAPKALLGSLTFVPAKKL